MKLNVLLEYGAISYVIQINKIPAKKDCFSISN